MICGGGMVLPAAVSSKTDRMRLTAAKLGIALACINNESKLEQESQGRPQSLQTPNIKRQRHNFPAAIR